jgi:hypothetical protein
LQETVNGKKKVFWNEKGFYKEWFVLKDCSKMGIKEDKDKSSQCSECHMKVLSRS